jgi:hypothetical protein
VHLNLIAARDRADGLADTLSQTPVVSLPFVIAKAARG